MSAADNSEPRRSAPLRRERAPTITIDTSAVSGTSDQPQPLVQLSPVSQRQPSSGGNVLASERSTLLSSSGISAADPRSPMSTYSSISSDQYDRESRPTSPHNILPPFSKAAESNRNFLSVPGTRPRGDSLDSEGTDRTSSTYGSDTIAASANHSSRSNMSKVTIINDEDALKPYPGKEAEFEVENNQFAFSPGQLNKLLNPKSLGAFHALGGLRGLEKGLRTNITTGLSLDECSLEGAVSFEDATRHVSQGGLPKSAHLLSPELPRPGPSKREGEPFSDRKHTFGTNILPERKAKSILQLAWIAYNDKVLILLTVAAVISLAVGIYQSVLPSTEAHVEWVEGVAIIVAILVVVVVGAANDWQKERQFVRLNKKKEDRFVKVLRSGKTFEISTADILVGDVLHLEPGDVAPVDGIFIDGHNVRCDESTATGESDVLRKVAAAEVYRTIEQHGDLSKQDPFIISGAKISEGVGTFLVTATGANSTYGKTMLSLQDDGQTTPLQVKLNALAEYIAKLGLGSGLLLFVALFIKYLTQLKDIEGGDAKGQAFLRIFIVAVTIVVVAVPEGLPLAVTLALAFATTRMLKDNNLVRLLKACETMGNATTICSDKTGTLTENKMTAVAATLGISSKFGNKLHPPLSHASMQGSHSSPDNSNVPASDFVATLSPTTKLLLLQSIVLNSTAFENEEGGEETFVGSKTETALLSFARTYLGMGPVGEERANAKIVQMVPFDSTRKCMAVVVRIDNGKYRMLVKGASEILAAKSSRIVQEPTKDLSEVELSKEMRATLDEIMAEYASRSLRNIALVYRDFDQWPPCGAPMEDDDPSLVDFNAIFRDMVMFGVFGIQDPVRAGVTDAVRQCQRAGVFVRMVTGDNIMTAKAIAEECGIFTPGGLAIEGPKFRQLSTRQMHQIIPRLQIVARSSPDDKKILVSYLKRLGETVAVTGDGTNDAQALKTADVGFSMGITGTEVAKEASDIILMDDNFASIVKAMAWGRTVNDAVKKFLQFQVTVNITAVILTFVSAVASATENSVLTAVQLLWVNLIMDTFAALALATDPPSPYVLDRRPEPKSAPLITVTMWKMIIGQSIYQLIVTFVLNFAGESIFGYSTPGELGSLQTTVFNTFVWMQIFNQWNSRRLDNKLNIFEGILKNKWFIGIQLIIVGGQILIIFVGGAAFSIHRLNGPQWGVSLVLGAISIPVAVIIRLFPDRFARKLVPAFLSRKKAPEVLVSDEYRRFQWHPALEEIRDQLTFLKAVRGGRLKQLKHKLQHPEELLTRSRSGSFRSRSSSVPETATVDSMENDHQTSPLASPDSKRRRHSHTRSNSAFGPAAAMAGIVAGSIAGWSPIDRGNEGASMAEFPSGIPHSGLDQLQGIELHPDTADDDTVVTDYTVSATTPPSQNPDLIPSFDHAPPERESSFAREQRSLSRHSRSSHSQS